jgi:hypothetical protein
MKKHLSWIVVASVVALAGLAVFLAPPASAEIVPLRSGSVVSAVDSGPYSFIEAVDAAGKNFWIITTVCTVGEKGKVAVLAGAHYDKIKSEHLGKVIEDVYTSQLLRVGDLEIPGFAAHGLPAGCVTLR